MQNHTHHTHTRTPPQNKRQNDDDAGVARWFPIREATSGKLPFAFDHGDIVKECAAWFEREGKGRGQYAEVA